MILFFQSSFRLSEKNEKDKKRKELTPVSATPTHMLRICVNPSFEHLLSPRGDSCEQSAPRPSGNCLTTATGSKRSSADSDLLLCHVRLRRTSRFGFGCRFGCEHGEIKFALHNTHVTPHPPLSRSPFSHWRRLAKILAFVSADAGFTPANPFMRACGQCVHESARFFRVICSHAWYS